MDPSTLSRLVLDSLTRHRIHPLLGVRSAAVAESLIRLDGSVCGVLEHCPVNGP